MTEVEKSRKKGKGAKKAEAAADAADLPATGTDGNATVSSLISAGLADLHNSGLLDDHSVVDETAMPEDNPIEAAQEELAVEWQMANEEILEDADTQAAMDSELGTTEEAEQMNLAAEEVEETVEAAPAEETLSEEDEAIADEELGPAEFIEADQVLSIIEALLFASQRPVSVGTIKQIFKGSNIRAKDITRALDDLASDYASGRRGVTLEEVNGGYQLRTKVDNADFLRRLSKSRPFRLSGPALETLSIIAYKQPITKHELDEIRGVESGHLVRALMERGLVNFAGKSELPGKPMLYQTTRKFLEIFGLRNLKELPTLSEIDELLPEGIGAEEEEKPKLADITGDLAQQVGHSYSEGEEELERINESLAQVDTSSEFFEQEKVRQRDKRDAERAANIREALAVGEAVDIKDQRWLTRYEAKLAAQSIQDIGAEGMPSAEAVEGAEATELSADAVADANANASADEADESISGDIENLSENLQADNRMQADDEENEDGDADFSIDNDSNWESLSGDAEFDEDDSGDAEV